MTPIILAVSGLTKEARMASGAGILAIRGGGNRDALERRLSEVDPGQIRAVISFGIAGALDPTLKVGDLILADAIQDGPERRPGSEDLRNRWARHLRAAGTSYREMTIAGVDAPLLTPADKAELRTRSGAGAVDMESHVAAAFAARHALPFGAIRVISDRANHVLPPVAGTAMRPDGSVDVLGVVRSLARDPAQIPALIATARDAAVAFRALGRVRSLLDPSGGLLGLDL
jgi:hopanoid-associated phosphorylase